MLLYCFLLCYNSTLKASISFFTLLWIGFDTGPTRKNNIKQTYSYPRDASLSDITVVFMSDLSKLGHSFEPFGPTQRYRMEGFKSGLQLGGPPLCRMTPVIFSSIRYWATLSRGRESTRDLEEMRTEKSFRNLIKSTRNQIVFFDLIWILRFSPFRFSSFFKSIGKW